MKRPVNKIDREIVQALPYIQIIPRRLCTATIAGNVRTSRIHIGIPRLDMINRIPAEDDGPIGTIDLLKHALHEPSLHVGNVDWGKIELNLRVNCQDGAGAIANQPELVLICCRAVEARFERLDDLVVGVEDNSIATGITKKLVAQERAEVIAPLIVADVKIMCIVRTNLSESSIDEVLKVVSGCYSNTRRDESTPRLSKM